MDMTIIPQRPIGPEPTITTLAVLDLLYPARNEAEHSLIEKLYGIEHTKGMAWIHSSAILKQRIQDELEIKVEYYNLLVFFIDRAFPIKSSKGIPIDRFETRWYVWNELFDK
jgi:hypothetical protein